MPRATQRTVQRKIHFYRVHAGFNPAGNPIPIDFEPVLRHVNTLSFNDGERYYEDLDGNTICCWVDRATQSQQIRLGTIRRTGFPQVEQDGNLSAIPIPANAGLAEQIHVQVFPNGIVGTDFNFYGPRIARLSQYLDERGNNLCPNMQVEQLLRQDVYLQLQQFGSIRFLQLRMRPTHAAEVTAINRDLGSTFAAAARIAHDLELEIILRPAKRQQSLPQSILAAVSSLAHRRTIHEEASKFFIKGQLQESGEVVQLDILDDQLIAKRDISLADGRSRALDATAAYRAIQSAYDELRTQLERALGVRQ